MIIKEVNMGTNNLWKTYMIIGICAITSGIVLNIYFQYSAIAMVNIVMGLLLVIFSIIKQK